MKNTCGELQFSRSVTYNTTKNWTSWNNVWIKMKHLCRRSPSGWRVKQLENIKAHMKRKMSEVIQKQKNQSWNIQKLSFKGEDVLKHAANLQDDTYAEEWFPCRCKRLFLKPGIGPWTQALINLDPEKPGSWKTWTQNTWTLKIMNPGKYGVNVSGIKK